MSAPTREDAAARLDRNLVVLAGAGTGKTSLLVERLLHAVGSGHLELPEAAAITFTEKAAAEMRHRLTLGLERLRARARGEVEPDLRREADRAFARLAASGVPAPEIAARALEAIDQAGAASIETIHGFCARLLRAWPREAGVDPGFEVDTGPGETAVLEEMWEAFLARELGPSAPRAAAWREVLARVPLDAVEAAARGLAGWGIPEELLDPAAPAPDARSLFGTRAAALVPRITDLLERTSGKGGLRQPTRGRLELFARALRAFADGAPGALADPELPDVVGRQTTAHPAGAAPGEVPALFDEARSLLGMLLRIDDAAIPALRALAAPFAREVREALLARGLVGFDALLALAARLLRTRREVREALKTRIRTLLVDEFQDTDPLQYEIVLWLAEQPGTSADDPYRALLGPGRLFVVGDPKQSIYRFRGADHAAFRRAVARIVEEGGLEVVLQDNWRAVPEVLDPVHDLFAPEAGTWIPSEHQPEYVPVRGRREDDRAAPPCVELWTVASPSGAPMGAGERRLAEARVLAREIRAMQGRGRVRYGEMTVLLRAFTGLRPLLRAFREHGVPFVVQGGREFHDRPEVAHLLAALRLAAHPEDAVALLAWLRSPAGGVTDVELDAWARTEGGWSPFARPDPADFPRLARALEVLRHFLQQARDLPPDGVVRAALDRTGLLTLEAAAFEGAQRVANLRKLAARAADLSADGRLSLAEVIEELDGGGGERAETESPLAEEGTDAVRILTIHAAKGLENRVVFLADLARGERSGDRGGDPVRLVNLPGGPAIAIRVDGATNAPSVWLEREDALHERAEGLRVLYVALTRARERLVLVAARPAGAAPTWLRALSAWGYDVSAPPEDGAPLGLGRVRHRRLLPDPAGPRAPAGAPARRDAEVAAWARALEIVRASAGPLLRRPSALHAERADRAEGGPDGGPRSTARAAGTAVHAVLERWDGDPRTLAALVPGEARGAAREAGADPEEVLAECRAILEAFAGSPLAGRLQAALPGARREVPVLLHEDGGTWAGLVDLLYRDPVHGWTVVDYKTDRDGDDGEVAARYREQLGIYARAVRRALALPAGPRAVLWLLRSGREIPV